MSLLGVHHVQLAIPVGGEATARSFYVDALGLVEVPKPAALAGRGGAWFRDAGSGLELHVGVDEPFTPARKAHPALVTDDLAALTARLRDAGADVASDVALDGLLRAVVHDPFGNKIELVQRTAG